MSIIKKKKTKIQNIRNENHVVIVATKYAYLK